MNPNILISCFQQFDESNLNNFLYPLGAPNPRIVSDAIIYRVVVSNIGSETLTSSTCQLVGSVNGKNFTAWPLPPVTLEAGGSIIFQGLSASVRNGLCVVPLTGIAPTGPVALRTCWKVDGVIEAECTMPLERNETDIYAAGPEHAGPMEDSSEVLGILIEKRDGLVGAIAEAQGAIKVLNPIIDQLKAAVGCLLLLFTLSAFAAPKEKSLYEAGEIYVETFAGVSTADFKTFDGLYGAGFGIAYHKNWLIGARVLHNGWDIKGTTVQDVQARVVGRLPLSGSLAPYLFVGVGYRLGSASVPKGRENLHLDSGGGLEYRFTKHLGAFVETGWSANLDSKNAFVGTGGLRVTF